MVNALTATPEIFEYWNLVDQIGLRFSADSAMLPLLFLVGALLCIVIPYFLGSVNPAILISKVFYHDDIRNHGSGNAGTTNMLRTYGKKAAVATILIDFGKAIVATLLGRLILGANGEAIAGLFVGLGHMFPIYYRFKGGKGVACFAMVGLVIHPLVFLGLVAIFLIVVIGTRFVSLASVMAAFLFPFLIKWFSPMPDSLHVAMGCIAAMLVVWMHRENLKRIWNNEEPRLDISKLKNRKKKEKNTEQSAEDASND